MQKNVIFLELPAADLVVPLVGFSSSRVLLQYDRDSLPVRTLLSWFELGIFAREVDVCRPSSL